MYSPRKEWNRTQAVDLCTPSVAAAFGMLPRTAHDREEGAMREGMYIRSSA